MLSRVGSLWIAWINEYLIKGRSFWDVKVPGSAPMPGGDFHDFGLLPTSYSDGNWGMEPALCSGSTIGVMAAR